MTKEDTNPYSSEYFDWQKAGALRSADIIVPSIIELVKPTSVVDIGCATGAWLAAFRRYGVADIFGIDNGTIRDQDLQISPVNFKMHDLRKPLRLGRTFDLVVCLEVAEHLPDEHAENLIETLTIHGPLILFSAAIPFQGGEGHINEQWQDYWAKLFEKHQYLPIDYIRSRVWNNERVEWWYSQNTILYAEEKHIKQNNALLAARVKTHPMQLNLVHPKNYLDRVKHGPGINESKFKVSLQSVEHIVEPRETNQLF
jgi:SAM-dependent methyltransferase